jgi:tRNA A37 methylthiotransferase MiaB
MMNPMFLSPILDRLIQVFVENEKIFKFLHIPVQSGSERILRKMKRGHTAKTFSDLVASFRTRVPKITIATDVIVGFPSETEHDFYETTELINETQPDIVNASKYSARPGTAATVEKQINTTVVKKRTKQLHHLIDMTSRKRNSIWSKWYGEILIDEKRGNKVQGRNYAYKPVVVTGNLNIGTHAFVYISGYTNHVLEGTINFHGVDETA